MKLVSNLRFFCHNFLHRDTMAPGLPLQIAFYIALANIQFNLQITFSITLYNKLKTNNCKRSMVSSKTNLNISI